jgi:membrane protease YdiL (CAAX protease family)
MFNFIQQVTGLNIPTFKSVVIAIVGGLTIPLFSLTFLTILDGLFSVSTNPTLNGPIWSGSILEVEVGNVSALTFILLAFILTAIVLPVIEEITFRGVLWATLDWASDLIGLESEPLRAAFLIGITSTLFAVAHMDPMHIIGVTPFAFFVGWLRHYSDSTIATTIAHTCNNTVAFGMLLIAFA